MRVSMFFAVIAAFVFAVTGVSVAGEKAAETKPAAAKPAATSDKAAAKPSKKGITVEEAYANKAKLNKTTVTVTGKVAKISRGIMGKTWVHVQDGTGKPGTNDLTATTDGAENVNTGDTVTVTGTLAADKDFGGGYFYAVIIEDAKVTKK
ncbi:MAG: hypothetical protein OEV59_07645 [Deltaproteobacteria bacterium]|nr:hypothetical protein [Deltaproteobacteria bacterium]